MGVHCTMNYQHILSFGDVATAAGVLLIVFVDSMRRMCICEMKDEQQKQRRDAEWEKTEKSERE